MDHRPHRFRLCLMACLRLALAVAVAGAAPTAVADEGTRYVDRNFGFSFLQPRFVPSHEKNVTTVAVTLAGSPVGLFAPNVNVVVQHLETSLADYQGLQSKQLAAIGWELIAQEIQSVNGAPALRTRARGSLQGLDVEFLAVAMVDDGGKMFIVTCTSLTQDFAQYEPEFDRVVSSFSLPR